MSDDESNESDLAVISVSEAAMQFRCVVCLSDPVDSHMCPKCSKLFCHGCLSTAYKNNNARTCPHCRSRVSLGSFVRAPFVADFMKTLRTAKTAETPKPVADKCPLHPAEFISVYCNDCSISACDSCWMDYHLDHKVAPLRAVHKTARKELEEELLPKINACISEFESRSELRRSSEARFLHFQKEGDELVKDTVSTIQGTWVLACMKEADTFEEFDEALQRLKSSAESLQRVAEDSNLNSLVDKYKDFNNIAERASQSLEPMHKLRGPLFDYALDVLKPWLPSWDFAEEIKIEDLKSWSHGWKASYECNGVAWTVFIYPCPSWREGLKIAVESPKPGSYEFRLEKELRDGRLIQSSIIASAKPRRRPPTAAWFRKEFPLEDPTSLFDGEESLRFTFKFRPLTYMQKIKNMGDNESARAMKLLREIESLKKFCEERLTDMSNKRKAEAQDVGETDVDTSLKSFKAELMTEISKLQDTVK